MKKPGRKAKPKRPRPAASTPDRDEILPGYDFSQGVRNKYAERYRAGTNLVLLEPDLAEQFPDSEAVNRALRSLRDDTQPAGGRRRRRREQPG
jgi:hypothetical protein